MVTFSFPKKIVRKKVSLVLDANLLDLIRTQVCYREEVTISEAVETLLQTAFNEYIHRSDLSVFPDLGYVDSVINSAKNKVQVGARPTVATFDMDGKQVDGRPKFVTEQLEEAEEKNKIRKWSKKHDHCQNCGTTEREHLAKGFCKDCYFKVNKKPSRKSKEAKREAENVDIERVYCANPDCPYGVHKMWRNKRHMISGKNNEFYCCEECANTCGFYTEKVSEDSAPVLKTVKTTGTAVCANPYCTNKKEQDRNCMTGFDGQDFCDLVCVEDYKNGNPRL